MNIYCSSSHLILPKSGFSMALCRNLVSVSVKQFRSLFLEKIVSVADTERYHLRQGRRKGNHLIPQSKMVDRLGERIDPPTM